MQNEKKYCPFNNGDCRPDCALFVDPSEMNEIVKNKLASVGVINREKGFCSYKNIAMCLNRQVFEQISNYFR